MVKNLPANAGDTRDVDLFPGSGRSPAVGNGNLLQYSCLDRGAWQAPWGFKELDTAEHECTHQCQTRGFTFSFTFRVNFLKYNLQ